MSSLKGRKKHLINLPHTLRSLLTIPTGNTWEQQHQTPWETLASKHQLSGC